MIGIAKRIQGTRGRITPVLVVLSFAFAASAAPAQQGDPSAGQPKTATCGACHGVDGNSITAEWPSLAGQHETYLVRQLMAYRDHERPDVGMQQFAATLSEQDMLDIAAYYASQTLIPKGADPSLVNLGEQIYRGGIPDRGIAACIACHGPTGRGNPFRLCTEHTAELCLGRAAIGFRQEPDDAQRGGAFARERDACARKLCSRFTVTVEQGSALG
jgi:cytochrome c553